MSSSKTQLIDSVFAGDGEIATRMRELDWSATPLGPVEQWPQALRTIVRVVLGSGYPMAICWGPDYVLLYNEAYRPITGTRHPWALGRGAREVYPEAWDFIGPMYESVMARGQAANFLSDALVPLTRNNYLEEVYFAFSASPIWDDNGRMGGVLNSALETTVRVLEDRRRQVLRDLASRTAGARTEEEVWRVSAETLGRDRLSLPFSFLYDYRPPKHQAYLIGASVETDEALHPPVIDCRGENLWRFDPALAMDGVLVELDDLASGVPVPNWPNPPKQACVAPIRLGKHNEALGFLVAGIHPGRAFDDAYRQFVNRITEQITIGLASARDYERERQRAEALAELDRAKTTFFSNVSHEFRTPLTLMLGPLDEVLPEASERLSPEHHELLVAVRRNGIRLLKLVNTLLDFSRIEAGRVQASYQPTDLAGFTTEIASAFEPAMKIAGLRFSVECLPIADPVYVDRDMWEKIVLNLLSNAYKFTFEGEVALTLKSVDGAVELQVRDTGVGIPEEHREHVFERFHRIESTQARTYEGTGIGLALAQELVKLHGGSVRVESAVGAGSTFTVTIPRGKEHLPAERIHAPQSLVSTTIRAEAYVEQVQQWLGNEPGVAADAATPPMLASPTPSSEPSPDAKREPIVLADDNADMRQYLTRLLSELYEVHAVADGRQALEATQQLRPALVLADVMMPHLDGFGLLRAIREDSALAGTPVILLSARAGEESRVEGLEADADDYLIKPFAARELLARVAANVKMSGLRRETAEREERMRSEAELEREKLRASEERLAETSRFYRELQRADAELQLQVALLLQLPVSAWTLKPDGTPDFVNQVWLEYSGQTLDFVRSHPEAWMTAVHPDDREAASVSFWNGVRSGQGFEMETRFRRARDRVYRWHLNRAVVLRDAEGKVLKFVGTSTDIDDRKHAEEALRASEGKLRQVIDAIPSLSWCNLPDGTNEFLSKGWHDYTGLSPDEAHGWGWQATFHPEDLPPLMKKWQELLISGEPGEIEARLRRHDGVYRWFLIQVAPFRDETGAILRWYGTSTDIHDRKLTDEALRASETNLRQTVNSIPGLICTMNPAGEIEELNQPLLEYFGKTPEELKGWRMTDAVHPDDLPGVIEAYRYSITTGTPYAIEHRCRRADGVYRWFQVRASAVRNADGHITGWYVLLTDIEDRKCAEDSLRASETNLREILDSIPGLVCTLSPAGEMELINRPFLQYFGKTLVEMKDWGNSDAVHPDDMPGVLLEFTNSITTGAPYFTEHRCRRADGVYRWFQNSARPMRDTEGRITRWYCLITDINDRKCAEDALRASERNLALTINTIPALTWSARPDGTAESFNQHYLDYVGLTQEQAQDWGWSDAIHPDDRNGLIDAWQFMMKADKGGECEARLRRFDGEYRWFLFRTNPLRDESGKTVKWYGTNTDIDGRKRAEEESRGSEARKTAILDSALDCIVTIDHEGCITEFNPAAERTFGYRRNEVMGKRLSDVMIPPSDREKHRQGLARYIATGETRILGMRLELTAVRADGTEFPVELAITRIPLEGAPSFTGYLRDITERKQAEEELRRSEAILAEGQRLSRTGTFFWRVATGRIVWSEQAYRIFEFDTGSTMTLELIGSRVHPEDRYILHDMVERAQSGSDLQYEHRLLLPDNRVKYLQLVGHGTKTNDGHWEYVGAVQDVTARRLSEEALDKARSELAHVTRITSLGMLTASIAHEVNQPLSGIITNASTCLRMLSSNPPNIEGALETARRTIRDGNRASEVVTRLRALFKRKEVAAESIDLNDAAREVIALSLSALQSNRIMVRQEFAENLPAVKGDRVQLQQVILNLLRNASDAMRDVEDRPRQLLIRTESGDSKNVQLTVQDTGIGFTPGTADRLFESFYTTKEEGMGIGLSVSRSIIEAHRGRLWATANDGPGASFAFSIPNDYSSEST